MSTPSSSKCSGRKTKLPILIVAVLIGLVFSYLVLVPFSLRGPLEHPDRSATLSELKQVYIGIRMYSSDHEGSYPPDLETVIREGYLGKNWRYLREDSGGSGTFSSRLHYHKPSAMKNGSSISPLPDTVLLSYENGDYDFIIAINGSGKMERKGVSQ